MLARDGMPLFYICSDVKGMVHGIFHKKLNNALFQLKQIEPYTSWTNARRGGLRSSRRVQLKTDQSNAPKRLLDDCLKLESYITSSTVKYT